MSQIRSVARRHLFDALVVIAALQAALEVAFRQDPLQAARTPVWFAAPATALVVLPLLARRRFPFAAPVTVWLAAAVLAFVDVRLVVYTPALLVAGLAAAFLLGTSRTSEESRGGLVIVLVGAALIVANQPNRSLDNLVFTPLQFAIAWVAGWAVRLRAFQAEAAEERATHAEREREAAARVAVAEERARIARELHDIVAHSVSVMVLQVGAVRHRLPEAMAEDKEALKGVEQAGRSALAEMRRLLGAMRSEGQDAELTPQPGLDALDGLAEEVRRAGLPVRVRRDGDPYPLPRAIDLSAYRIIQEGLTNVLKHARATAADVTIRYGSKDLQLEIRDNGRGVAASDGLGHGLVGVRERVKIYGGEMTAGAADGGGFVLTTLLPVGGERP